MKRFSFSLVAVMVTLMVLAVSCSMPMGATGGYYDDEPVNRNVYYSNPYGSNVIVVERDPYTGRYYQVSPYGGGYSNSYGNAYPYDNRYNRRRYSNNNGSSYNNQQNAQQQQQRYEQQVQAQQQQQQQKRETIRQMESSKESILGKKKD